MRRVLATPAARMLAVGLAVVLLASACGSSDDDALPEVAPTSSTSTATTATTTPAPPSTEPDTSDENPDVAAVKAVWTEFVRVAADRSDPARVAELSTGDVSTLAEDQFFDPRDAQSFYTQVSLDGETATIEDCSFLSQPLSEFNYVPINGAAELISGEWKISDLEVLSVETCIPGDVAGEVYAAYEGFWDAELVEVASDDPGQLVFEFRLLPPVAPKAQGTQRSREIIAGASISRARLEGIRSIVVVGEQNRRSVRR